MAIENVLKSPQESQIIKYYILKCLRCSLGDTLTCQYKLANILNWSCWCII